MPIHTVCPECDSPFSLPDDMRGKKIRCGKCQAVFPVKSAPLRRRGEEEDEDERPRSRIKVADSAPARRSPVRRDDDDDEDDDRPVRRPVARRGRARDEEEEDRRAPARSGARSGGSVLPWVVGGLVACVFVVTAGVVAAVILTRGRSSSNDQQAAVTTPVAQAPINPPVTPPVAPVVENPPVVIPPVVRPPEVRPPAEEKVVTRPAEERPVRSTPGELTREARDKVKRGTVYLRVTMAEGGVASGSGFFGDPEARNIILTNAHVVGMLAPDSARPRKIEVFINSGEADEKVTSARVLGVDRASDLAVLDVGITEGMPEPLTVKSAAAVSELDKVYVFGFPLGERLGKEITIRPSSVSSLRKKGGVLDRIQVNGGMDPGNSGGPVVDDQGHVIGVAVSGIPGRAINFAIPGERVHTILGGRISVLGMGQSYYAEGGQVAVPVTVEMIDPRNRVRQVAVEIWTGNAPAAGTPGRPPAKAPPEPRVGDGPRQKVILSYLAGVAKGDIVLPDLPPGKVYWQQPSWTFGTGEVRWAAANVFRPGTQPVERRPATLALRLTRGTERTLTLTTNARLRVSADEESEVAAMRSRVTLRENVVNVGAASATLNLTYTNASREVIADGRTLPSKLLEKVRPHLSKLRGILEVDGAGNLRQNTVALAPGMQRSPLAPDLMKFHETVQLSLDSLAIPLPGRQVNALESWKATRMVALDTPDGSQKAALDMTVTYLGQRKRNGKDEAVLAVQGLVRDREVGGKASGTVLVDVATGVILLAEVTTTTEVTVRLDLGDRAAKVKVISAMTVRLERGT